MLTETQRKAVAISYRLTPAMIKVFELLLEVPLATNEMVEGCVNGDCTPAKLVIYRLRRLLRFTTIRINKRNKAGYWIDTGTKAHIMRTINDNIRYIASESNGDKDANNEPRSTETV
jgi:hypothetical protein